MTAVHRGPQKRRQRAFRAAEEYAPPVFVGMKGRQRLKEAPGPRSITKENYLMALANERSSHPALSCADGLAANSADILLLIGRILLAWVFVRSGYGKLFNIDTVVAGYVSRGIPTFLAYLAIPVEFFGGLALMFGFATRYVAILMFGFTLIATLSSHRYWEFADPVARRAQDSSFYKNMAMLGGFFFLFICGAGRLSLDGWLRKRG